MNCPLCELARGENRIARLWYEDDKIVVVDCKTCKVPMGLLKFGHNAPFEDKRYLVMQMEALFPGKFIDQRMRQIPEHFHCHAR